MVVLSLFDGMSCGQIALRELDIPVSRYYASEIDRHAISQTQLNFPYTLQLGDVRTVRACDLPKIDLLIGGSPCQGFSLAGKGLNFSDPRSALFFEFVRIWHEVHAINPDALFLLENVCMKKEYESVINRALGLYPVLINSSPVSAQRRARLYWTNIRTRKEGFFGEVHTDIPQPPDRGVYLRDILDVEVDERHFLKPAAVQKLLLHKARHEAAGHGFGAIFHDGNMKMSPLRVGGQFQDDLVIHPPRSPEMGLAFSRKMPTLTTDSSGNSNFAAVGGRIRRLTLSERSQLQTIPEWYRWECSEAQAYKMLGNGWTVEVIKHIFSYAIFNNHNNNRRAGMDYPGGE